MNKHQARLLSRNDLVRTKKGQSLKVCQPGEEKEGLLWITCVNEKDEYVRVPHTDLKNLVTRDAW